MTEDQPSNHKTPPSSERRAATSASGHDNAFGFLRLCMALLVLVDHAFPLGGFEDGSSIAWSHGQETLGGLAVAGFFAISGYLITKSALANPWLAFLWRRALRILPAYWMVLLVGAGLVGPLIWKLQGLGLSTYFTSDESGPLAYLLNNAFLRIGRYGIHDIYAMTTPYGLHVRSSVLNGSLWTLIYEGHCYLFILLLALSHVLQRARPALVALAVLLLALVNLQLLPGGPGAIERVIPFLHDIYTVRYTCIFLLGSVAAVYGLSGSRSDRLGLLALGVCAVSLAAGGWFLIGYPALVYALLWLSTRLPARIRRIGAVNDYSYGIYLYGFLVQQTLAYFQLYRFGVAPFIAFSIAGSFACAWLSWHLVEMPAMRLKDWSPRPQSLLRNPDADQRG